MTCGLRIGEVLALRSKDLDLEDVTVTVAGTVAKVGSEGERPILFSAGFTADAPRGLWAFLSETPSLEPDSPIP